MSKQIEVEKIVIKIGAKKLELTAFEADELRKILDELLAKTVVIQGAAHWIYTAPIYPYGGTLWNYDTSSKTISITKASTAKENLA